MSGLLNSLGKLLTRDLTGRTWQREASHPYFTNLIYFGSKDEQACYWEAEVQTSDEARRVGVTMKGTPAGPTAAEEQFCRAALADLDALFEKCRSAFQTEFVKWTKQPMPADWRGTFKLDGFQIPINGDALSDWELCYFVEPAGHYFTAVFDKDRVKHVAVDG